MKEMRAPLTEADRKFLRSMNVYPVGDIIETLPFLPPRNRRPEGCPRGRGRTAVRENAKGERYYS